MNYCKDKMSMDRTVWLFFCKNSSNFLISNNNGQHCLKVPWNPSKFAFICTQIGLYFIILEIFSFFVRKKFKNKNKKTLLWEKKKKIPASLCALLNFLSPAPKKKKISIDFLLSRVTVTWPYTSSREEVCTSREESARGLLLLYTDLATARFCYQKFLICSLFPLINWKCPQQYLEGWSELALVSKRCKFT